MTTDRQIARETAKDAEPDIIEQLLGAAIGHPYAEIPWPHRVLHNAVKVITELRAARALEQSEGWVKVETKLPEKVWRYQVALQFPEHPQDLIVTEAIFDGADWCDSTCDELKGVVKYYRPLPSPPNSEETANG